MLEVVGLDACDPLAVVNNFGPRLDQSVKHDVAVEVDNRDSCQTITLLCQDPLAVECQDFGFPTTMRMSLNYYRVNTYFPRLSP